MSVLKSFTMKIGAKYTSIFDDDDAETTGQKIWFQFKIGDMLKIFGCETIFFQSNHVPLKCHTDIQCPIIFGENGYWIAYPKGFLVHRELKKLGNGTKEFRVVIRKTSDDKHFYEIWRSK